MDYKLPFKKDRHGLLYLNEEDIKITNLESRKIIRENVLPAKFYAIEGTLDIIIKDCTISELLLNRYRYLKLLRKLINKQPNIKNIDFPIGYFQSNNEFKGLLIPYYKESISLDEVITNYTFDDLNTFYNKKENDIDNFIALLLEIIDILKTLVNNGIYYLDIGPGNFLIYNNSIKLIDFAPSSVFFNDKKLNIRLMLIHYSSLVNELIKEFGFKNIDFKIEENFYNTEWNVKDLRKRLER